MLRPERQSEIRGVARATQNKLWSARAKVWQQPPLDPRDMFPLRIKDVIVGFLGLKLEEPDVIPIEGNDGFVTAGVLDRARGTIVIAKHLPIDQRVFTGAHEIGHFFLHPGLVYHHSRLLRRDRPLSGPDRSQGRDLVEQEADLFAAEFLMPTRLVRSEFEERFGTSVDRSHPSEDLAFYLSGPRRTVTAYDLMHKVPAHELAFWLAKQEHFGGRQFSSLASRFRVSPSAMSIQLTDLGLVK
jgi:hypothetical protein